MRGLNLVKFTMPRRLFNGEEVTVCVLYDTLVARIIKSEQDVSIYLNHGGWVTASTVKAMNKALAAASIQGRVFRKKGAMFFDFNDVKEIDSTGFIGVY